VGQAVMRKFAGLILVLVVFCGWNAWNSWSYHHPGVTHNCRMLAADCPSHYAVWGPGQPDSPLYVECVCAATLTIHGSTR
jgi:hypothetical protein